MFDDDFFRPSFVRGGRPIEGAGAPARAQEDYDIPKPLHVQYAEAREAAPGAVLSEPGARVPSFAGGQPGAADRGEADELDIPAFLRRGN